MTHISAVEWRCALCPATGTGLDEDRAFWKYEAHYARVHHERPER